MDALLAAVDFPSFVAGLIQSVFGAIVNAAVKRMEAYAALITAVSLSVDHLSRRTSPKNQRDMRW